MKNKIAKFLPVLSTTLIIVYVIAVLYIRFTIPDTKTIIEVITNLYASYGYPLIFVSGILEAMFLLGMYVPGTAAILLGAVVAKSGVLSLPIVIILATFGLMIGYTFNYFLGKLGWYHALSKFGLDKGIKEAEKKLQKHGKKTIMIGFISPTTGSFVATAAGVAKMPFGRFIVLTSMAQLFWSTVWGIVAYLVGTSLVEALLTYFVYIIWIVVIVWFVRQFIAKRKKS